MITKMKQNYELTYLILPSLNQEEAGLLCGKVNDFVQESQGLVFNSLLPKKIPLAYPIKKETSAWLETVSFSLDKSATAAVDKRLKESKEILRYLFLKKEKERKIVLRQRLAKPAAPASLPDKAELEEIDKKLEEILN